MWLGISSGLGWFFFFRHNTRFGGRYITEARKPSVIARGICEECVKCEPVYEAVERFGQLARDSLPVFFGSALHELGD